MLYSPRHPTLPTASASSTAFFPIPSPPATETATATTTATTTTAVAAAAAALLFRIMSPFDPPQHHYSVFPAVSGQDNKQSGRHDNNSNSNSNNDLSYLALEMAEEPPPPLPAAPAPHVRSVFSMQDTLDSLYDEWVSIHIVFRSLQGAFPARPPPPEREEEYLDEIDRELSITYDDLMVQVRRLHRNLNRLAREMAQYRASPIDPRHRQL